MTALKLDEQESNNNAAHWGGDRSRRLEDNNEDPSHIRICKSILSERSKKAPSEYVTVVKESEEVCYNADKPHSSLLQIFASAFLSAIGRSNGANVWYSGNCKRTTTEGETPKTVQELLPSPLYMPNEINQIDVNAVERLCGHCIDLFEKNNDMGRDPGCILFGGQYSLHDNSSVSRGKRRLGMDFSGENRNELSGMQIMLSSVRKNLATAVKALETESAMNEHTAVILLSARSEHLPNSFHPVPHVFYPLEIPRHISNIEIISPPQSCKTDCEDEGNKLRLYLHAMYPRAKVEFITNVPSGALFAKMMTAQHLICPDVEICLFPSFSRISADKYSSLAVQNMHHMNPLAYSLLTEQLSSQQDSLHSSSNVKVVEVDHLIKSLPTSGRCRDLRGIYGRWVQDMKLAPRLQYETPLRHHYGVAEIKFEPSGKQPYRKSTTYKFEHAMLPFCGIDELMTMETFCPVMEKLGVSRVMMVGDSLQQGQAFSFWKVLGHLDNPFFLEEGRTTMSNPNFSRDIKCDHANVEFTFIRNDQMIENDLPLSFKDGVGNCKRFCFPWTSAYLSHNDVRTLLVASFGSHYYDRGVFGQAFDEFVRTVDGLMKEDDIVLYRTTVPGHADCQAKSSEKKPFDTYQEYEPTITDVFSWDKFISYNDYADRVLHKRAADAKSRGIVKTRMELLDVYPMTILRNDGHVGGEECAVGCDNPTPDCLHYNLPGPADWWNHLMLNNLADIALEMKPDAF